MLIHIVLCVSIFSRLIRIDPIPLMSFSWLPRRVILVAASVEEISLWVKFGLCLEFVRQFQKETYRNMINNDEAPRVWDIHPYPSIYHISIHTSVHIFDGSFLKLHLFAIRICLLERGLPQGGLLWWGQEHAETINAVPPWVGNCFRKGLDLGEIQNAGTWSAAQAILNLESFWVEICWNLPARSFLFRCSHKTVVVNDAKCT